MFDSVLIANRGAIAVRIIRTLKTMGVRAIAIYSEADADSPHVAHADEAYSLGEGRAADTYLNTKKLFDIIKKSGAQAVHPGYGFLSENADFCDALEAAGIAFIGPTSAQMVAFGLKHEARALAEKARVPLLPGTGLLESLAQAVQRAEGVGYPVMLKSTAGGGGIGMQICYSEKDLATHWESIKRLSENNFSNAGVFLEKYIEHARHIEVQVFGDGRGDALILGDRDCSSQRRHQKVIEEAPAPGIPENVREQLHATAYALVTAVNYRNAGTVEFIYNQSTDEFYFLEVNTRLQVEHGVTELIYKVDLVRWMVELAAGTLEPLAQIKPGLKAEGHAVQARVYAENPARDFQPSTGLLTAVKWPAQQPGLRIDHWLQAGLEISPLYDPMLAKVMVYQSTREQAVAGLKQALGECVIQGITSNLEYVNAILDTPVFAEGEMTTRFLKDFAFAPEAIEVIAPGTMTTVQDYPGRVRYWHVGVPPSGPFDGYSFRLGNRLLGNDESAAGLEITLNGPTLFFHCRQTVALTGAAIEATLDGQAVELYTPLAVEAGQTLKIGKVQGAGARAYLLFAGGLPCEPYLGSRSTFTLGQFGGFSARALRTGDMLPVTATVVDGAQVMSELLPEVTHEWQLHVMVGPHSAPDFFTEEDVKTFFKTRWQVHYNSSRTGVRLIGPKPEWARRDGGEAGLHPSNIHDNAYAIGAVDFTGDMPVILGPDGPSLGGFVCPVTVISADLWKLGQLKAGDKIQFVPVAREQALAALNAQEQSLQNLSVAKLELPAVPLKSPVVESISAEDNGVAVVYRQQGDKNLLVEYGPLELDIRVRFRIHALMLWLQKKQEAEHFWLDNLWDITPGVRSLQIHFNPLAVSLPLLLKLLREAEHALSAADNLTVPSRVVHIPLSWNDIACKKAVEKYVQSVRKDAPWCPDNIEFIRRINGLESVDQVKDIVFNASYVVLGLGDVYLGAPVATPLDPRHRLVTTKYNPARTWTAENSVGIGGSYMCVYGMEGPGGYQFVGRTLQMWNRYKTTDAFTQPWLLRFFDQVKFYEVSHEQLQKIRKDFPNGRYPVKIEETQFSLDEYEAFLEQNQQAITQFTHERNAAFQQELDRWVASGQFHFDSDAGDAAGSDDAVLKEGEVAVESPVSGNVWQLNVKPGQAVKEGDLLCVLESMKMEIEVMATESGVITRITRNEGQQVAAGQALFVLSGE